MNPPNKTKIETVKHFFCDITLSDLLKVIPKDIPYENVIIDSSEEFQISWFIQTTNDNYDQEFQAYESFLQKQKDKKLKLFLKLKEELNQ